MARAEAATLACRRLPGAEPVRRLVVFPAAGFPLMAKQNGARLGIVNREATDMDAYADLVRCTTQIGPAMTQAAPAS